MTSHELREKLSLLDDMARSTIERALEASNGDTNKDVKGRILRALSGEGIPSPRPLDVVYELNLNDGKLHIKVRIAAFLSIGTLKKEFLESKGIKGKWKLSGKPSHPHAGYKQYLIKKEEPKKQKITQSQRHNISFNELTSEQKEAFLLNIMNK